jgi:four helix bundle protein
MQQLKRSYIGDIIARPLLRAVTSIGANIAEGYGRHEGKEYLRFLEYAYGSSNEVDNWLTVLRDSAILPQDKANGLIQANEEIVKMLVATIKKIKGNSTDTIKQEKGRRFIPYPLSPYGANHVNK